MGKVLETATTVTISLLSRKRKGVVGEPVLCYGEGNRKSSIKEVSSQTAWDRGLKRGRTTKKLKS